MFASFFQCGVGWGEEGWSESQDKNARASPVDYHLSGRFAPASHKRAIQRVEPFSAAAYNGVAPGLWSVMCCSISAPASNRRAVHSGLPFKQEWRSGERPKESVAPTSAPASMHTLAQSVLPREQLTISGDSCSGSQLAFTSAFASTRSLAHSAEPCMTHPNRDVTRYPRRVAVALASMPARKSCFTTTASPRSHASKSSESRAGSDRRECGIRAQD